MDSVGMQSATEALVTAGLLDFSLRVRLHGGPAHGRAQAAPKPSIEHEELGRDHQQQRAESPWAAATRHSRSTPDTAFTTARKSVSGAVRGGLALEGTVKSAP